VTAVGGSVVWGTTIHGRSITVCYALPVITLSLVFLSERINVMRSFIWPMYQSATPKPSRFVRVYATGAYRARTRKERAAHDALHAPSRLFYAPPTARPRLVTSLDTGKA